MSISPRQQEILKIIGESTYISVNELAKLTFTSPSSIRRDLTSMQRLGLVKRSHGGVSLPETNGSVAGFYNRVTKNIKEKKSNSEKSFDPFTRRTKYFVGQLYHGELYASVYCQAGFSYCFYQ